MNKPLPLSLQVESEKVEGLKEPAAMQGSNGTDKSEGEMQNFSD